MQKSEAEVQSFFEDGNLPADTLGKGKNAWLTMMALYVLENKFKERVAEWSLIADKAKQWLVSDAMMSGLEYNLT